MNIAQLCVDCYSLVSCEYFRISQNRIFVRHTTHFLRLFLQIPFLCLRVLMAHHLVTVVTVNILSAAGRKIGDLKRNLI